MMDNHDYLAWIYFEAWLASDEVMDLDEWGDSLFTFIAKFRSFEERRGEDA